MRRFFFFFLWGACWLTASLRLQAQQAWEPNLKYGKPSKAELVLDRYESDTAATAIYLFRQGETRFAYDGRFRLETEVRVRLKVLKPAGQSYAQVAIPYYAPAGGRTAGEVKWDVDGCSYNQENGKTVKTKLKSGEVSDERLDAYYRVLKFTMPAVGEGTVLEYRYQIESDFHNELAPWMMQQEIPVVYSSYEIEIPLFYVYDIGFIHRELIGMEEKNGTLETSGSELVGVSKVRDDQGKIATRRLTFTSRHLPALRTDEPFNRCPQENYVQVNFNLQGTNFPHEGYRPLSLTWADVDKQLLEKGGEAYEFYGRHLSMANPYRDETVARFAGKNLSFEERLAGAFDLVRQEMGWNGVYGLYSENLEQAIADGRGTNADMNFVFLSVLKDLGLQACPVVLSRRSCGQLPRQFASLQRLNTFVVAVKHPGNGAFCFLDLSMDRPWFNVLPQDLLASRARILSSDLPEDKKWVDLSQIARNRRKLTLEATMDAAGQVTGQLTALYEGQEAWARQQEKPSADSTLTRRTLQEGQRWESRVTETAVFTGRVQAEGDHWRVNPMLLPFLTANPLTQAKRDLPIDFPYPQEVEVNVTLTLPEDCEVEQLPQVSALSSEENDLYIRYLLRHVGNRLLLTCTFGIAECTYPAVYYPELQRFFDRVVEACESVVVLKR